MFCDEVIDALEAIAAGELTPDGRISAHLASCRDCAAALDDARAVERLLRARPAPKPAASFTARTMTRVRRARWRSEQAIDAGFNVAIALVLAAIVGAGWLLVKGTGLGAVGGDAMTLARTGVMSLARQVAPSLPLYGGAAAVIVSALGVWWWAEN